MMQTNQQVCPFCKVSLTKITDENSILGEIWQCKSGKH